MAFKPSQCSTAVDTVITAAADKYNIPRWWLYVMAHRESSFDPTAVSADGNDEGLLQLSGSKHNGTPYPMNLATPDNQHQQWIWDMGINTYGEWVLMTEVSEMNDPFDATENLDRFCSVHAVPWWFETRDLYPGLSMAERWRSVAWHWFRGYFTDYDPNGSPEYFDLYDQYVSDYRAPVEVDDGIWSGEPRLEEPTTPPSEPATTGTGPWNEMYGVGMFGDSQQAFVPPDEETEPTPAPLVTLTSSTFDVAAAPLPVAAESFPANNTTVIRIRVLDQALRLRASVDDYESCAWQRDMFGENKFRLNLPATVWSYDDQAFIRHPAEPFLRENNYVYIEIKDEQLEDDFKPEFLGLIDYVRHDLSVSEENIEVRGDPLLRRREILPPMDHKHADYNQFDDSPSTAREPITGPAETAIYTLVNNQFGSGAIIDRRLPSLSFAPDEGRGSILDTSARYDNLLEKLQEIGQSNRLGFEFRPFFDFELSLMFAVFRGKDRSVSSSNAGLQVIFSPDSINIESMEMEVSSLNRPNTITVGGQGEGEDRVLRHVSRPLGPNDPPDQKALFLPGGGERVDLPASLTRGLSEFSIDGWFRWQELDGTDALILETVEGSTTTARFALRLNASTQHLDLVLRPDDSTAEVYELTSVTVPRLDWCWVAVSVDLAAKSCFIWLRVPDRDIDVDQTFTIDAGMPTSFVDAPSNRVRFGWFGTPKFFHGTFSRWRFWHAALTELELLDLTALPVIPTDLAIGGQLGHEWRFDDLVGAWVTDYKGEEHGRIVGSDYKWVQSPQGVVFALDEYYGLDRYEHFQDARDLEDSNALITRALSKFEDFGARTRFDVEILPTGPYRYRVHFDLGDIVTSRNYEWSVLVNRQIRRVEGSVERNAAPVFRLSLGSPSPDFPSQVQRGIRRFDPELRR